MAQFDPAHRAQTDPWIPEGQADDRTPMDGSVRNSDENSSGQRALPGDAINRCSRSGRKRDTTDKG